MTLKQGNKNHKSRLQILIKIIRPSKLVAPIFQLVMLSATFDTEVRILIVIILLLLSIVVRMMNIESFI